MISLGFSALPLILLIASSIRLRSYVISTAIDDVPVDTIPNMSPSWTSIVDIFLNNCRIRGVSRKFMCKSSTKNRKMRPAASFLGRAGGRIIPSCGGGGGGAWRL